MTPLPFTSLPLPSVFRLHLVNIITQSASDSSLNRLSSSPPLLNSTQLYHHRNTTRLQPVMDFSAQYPFANGANQYPFMSIPPLTPSHSQSAPSEEFTSPPVTSPADTAKNTQPGYFVVPITDIVRTPLINCPQTIFQTLTLTRRLRFLGLRPRRSN